MPNQDFNLHWRQALARKADMLTITPPTQEENKDTSIHTTYQNMDWCQ